MQLYQADLLAISEGAERGDRIALLAKALQEKLDAANIEIGSLRIDLQEATARADAVRAYEADYHEKPPPDPGVAVSRRVDQIALFCAIGKHVGRHDGFNQCNARQMNSMIAAANLVVEAFAQPHQPAYAGMGTRWASCDDRGASSDFMADVLGKAANIVFVYGEENNHPHDWDDFKRCEMLLRAVPELRPHLPRMAEHGEHWSRLVGVWDEAVALLDAAEAAATEEERIAKRQEMNRLIDPERKE